MTTKAKETTSDTSAGIKCPACGWIIQNLWDYEWGTGEDIRIECSRCDAPLWLTKRVSVSYTARAAR